MKRNAIWVLFSNLLSLVLSLFVGVFFPKYVSLETYASYREYSLYISYAGIFHFGFINGVYLKYGACNYSQIPQKKFCGYTRALMTTQIFIQVALILIVELIYGKNIWYMPILYVIANIFAINVNCYYSLISQFTCRFKLDAVIQMAYNFLIFLFLGGALLLEFDNYVLYLNGITIINYFILIVWLFIYKNISFGKINICLTEIVDWIDNIRRGSFVMLSEFVGIAILGIDSIFVNVCMTRIDFSMYSLAVSIISAIFQLIMICSNLIFPYLARAPRNLLKECYSLVKRFVMFVSIGFIGIIYLADFFISNFLTNYLECRGLIRILGITLVFRCFLNLIAGNFYKVMDLERDYFKNNIVAVILGLLTDTIAYLVWGTKDALAVASVVAFGIWFTITDVFFGKKLNLKKDVVLIDYMLVIVYLLIYVVMVFAIPRKIGVMCLSILSIFVVGYIWQRYMPRIESILKKVNSDVDFRD